MTTPKCYIKNGKERSAERQHPWIFSGAIHKIEGSCEEGDTIEVLNHAGKTLGFGHYQQGSITVRMLNFTKQYPDQNFYNQAILSAWNLRKSLGFTNSAENQIFRLIHGEGDFLPGLIADYYNGNVVLQCHSIGMFKNLDKISQALIHVLGQNLQSIYQKSASTLPAGFSAQQQDGYTYQNADTPLIAKENGNAFYIDWITGQKTGFFIDQRENRKLLAHYAAGKKILNTFCYSGGFSVYALNAGAALVHSVDSSQKAIQLTDANIELNQCDKNKHASFVADTMDYIRELHEDYDIIILDPPAFAKHRDARHKAVQGYKRLNAHAIRQIKPGGIIFTFSCSQVVDKALFSNTIIAAAFEAGRQVRILEQLHQPADHPINAAHPEGEYLKGLVIQVS
ncbi:MAG: class I SAM-dependent rRNA methyltransferase [Crocinitomicaceae bacterium]|nr:class I SAM-dependent rRNA methyltransferase [Crocinitomicaceae bacterium]MBK8924908.1 class I SAM-dependent rRNA methyltransferase [Crocinitomicaceae bacterium]